MGKLRTNCGCGGHVSGRVFRSNLVAGEWQALDYEGRAHLIVPLVMARADVPMNDGYLPVEEMLPETWDGVPVTVGHPLGEDGNFVSASASPEVLSRWNVGRIFNARVEGSSLKADAYIDVERAEQVLPGLIAALKEPGRNMEVSTGFYARDEESPGSIGGRTYKVVSREVRPNHLALLPFEEGACSWQDGCGVRTHKGRRGMTKPNKAKVQTALDTLRSALGLAANHKFSVAAIPEDEAERQRLFSTLRRVFKPNERGEDDDRRQIIADLVSNDESPFLPDDEDSLRMMSDATLRKMQDEYLMPPEEVEAAQDEGEIEDEPATAQDEGEEDEPVVAQDEGEIEDEPATARRRNRRNRRMVRTNKRGTVTLTVSQLSGLIAKETQKAVGALLTDDHRHALKLAKDNAAAYRKELVEKIVANSAIDAKALNKWSLEQLEVMAKGILPPADYSGRAVIRPNAAALADDDDVKDMVPLSSFHVAAEQRKKAN